MQHDKTAVQGSSTKTSQAPPVQRTSALKAGLRGQDLATQVQMLSPGGDDQQVGAAEKPAGEDAVKPLDAGTWAKTVRAKFDTWDADGNGIITAQEAQAASASGQEKGADLAALLVLERMMKELAALSKADGKKTRGMSKVDLDEYEKSYPKVPGRLAYAEEAFGMFSDKLTLESTQGLYGKAGKPDYKALEQGGIGTCYYLAPLTALAARDPGAIMQMIQEVPGQEGQPTKYIVTFPDQAPVTVVLDNVRELMMQAWARDNGVWVTVMERAFAALGNKAKGKKKERTEDKELEKAEGGFETEGIEVLTGNESKVLNLRGKQKGEIDQAMIAAMTKGALVCTAIDKNVFKRPSKKPLPDGHAYTVLGYVGQAVTIRNPWGPDSGGELMDPATQKPLDGNDDGEFVLTLDRWIDLFSSVTIEQK